MILDKKSLILTKKILFIVSLSFVFLQTTPQVAVASNLANIDYGRGPALLAFNSDPNSPKIEEKTIVKINAILPKAQNLPFYETYITATAYTSRVEETDSDPYIAAWGDHVFWGMVATNNFPKGTKIQIPEYFGDKMFTVLDRMNDRYYHRLDIWMPELSEAKLWGAKYIKIKVFK